MAPALRHLIIAVLILNRYSYAQNSSSVTNNAAPSANVSTNASGGTQINQQLNNVFDTSYGFGPGIICRTPQIVINGGYGSSSSILDTAGPSTNQNAGNYTGSISLAIPIGSSVIQDCQKFAAQIARDRVISSELSLIRACKQLEAEKITVDPVKYPNLASCLPSPHANTSSPVILKTSRESQEPVLPNSSNSKN